MDFLSLLALAGALISAHWAEILGVCYALINLANALAKGPEAKGKLAALADFLAVLARKDAAGTLKAPMAKSKPLGSDAPAPKSPPDLKALVALPLAFVVGLSGCACFRPSSDEYNSKKCVVARQVLDCTKDSLVGLLPLLPGIAVALMSGQPIDWQAVAQGAQDKGLANAACILAAIRVDFSSPDASAASLGLAEMDPDARLELARRAGLELERLAAQHYGGAVDVRMPESRGKRALVRVRASR